MQSDDPFDQLNPVTGSHLLRRIDDERQRDLRTDLIRLEGKLERTDNKLNDLVDKFTVHDKDERQYRDQLMGILAIKKSADFGIKVIAWVVMVGGGAVSILTYFWSRAQ